MKSLDSGITRIDGELRNGGTIRVRTRTGGNRTFRLRVRQIPGKVMTWTGGASLGLFKGVRTFTLTPHGGMTDLHVREEFTGHEARVRASPGRPWLESGDGSGPLGARDTSPRWRPVFS